VIEHLKCMRNRAYAYTLKRNSQNSSKICFFFLCYITILPIDDTIENVRALGAEFSSKNLIKG